MTAPTRPDEPIIFPGQLTVEDFLTELDDDTFPTPTALED